MDIRDAYARAESFLSWNVSKLYFGAQVKPTWIGGGGRFWYHIRRREGTEFVLVDPATRSKRPAFDHARLATALSAASGTRCKPEDLPFACIEFLDDETAFRFEALGRGWRFDLASGKLVEVQKPGGPLPGELLSPNGRWAAFVNNHNLFVRDTQTGRVQALTHDGEPHHGYACSTGATLAWSIGRPAAPRLPVALWSPDSQRLLTHRIDERRVGELHLIQSVPTDGTLRPVLHSYRYPMAGDEQVGMEQLLVLDVPAPGGLLVQHEGPIGYGATSIERSRAWWAGDGLTVYVLRSPRGERTVRLYEVDARTGSGRLVVEENSSTWCKLRPTLSGPPNVRLLPGGRQVIWYSERDGWGHLYLYEMSTGELANQITGGTWVVHDILRVDDRARCVYLTAGGREKDRDPYLRHLYRVGLDGRGLELLTPEDADHEISLAPEGSCFVDHHSRIDSPPVSVLRSSDGQLLLELEHADLGSLLETGWRYPERFRVKARDGVTDIYGMVCRPTWFDPAQRYPVIDAVYPGVWAVRTPKAFPVDPFAGGWFWDLQALAELGCIVVTIDGLGTPYRSRAFHEHAYADEAAGCALEDHIAGLRQLAARDPCMDLDRVGVIGHSAGGYAATRAILAHPEFYKVAVCSAGVQGPARRHAITSEALCGYPLPRDLALQDNPGLARNLEGHLLVIQGDLDGAVNPANTLQLVDALISANKDFDLVILPNRTHQYYREVYMLRRVWDYFTRHLLGMEPPRGYQIGAAPQEGEHT